MEAKVNVALKVANPGFVEDKQGVRMSAILTDRRILLD
jgi:hypothetical protein